MIDRAGRTAGRFSVIVALSLAGCGEPAPEPARAPASAAGERTTVVASAIPDLKPVVAVVSSRDTAEARARIGGTLVQLSVREGDVVARGQIIGRVADQRIGLETRSYEAQVGAAVAAEALARADLGRIRQLYEKGIYAKARLEQAEAEAAAALGTLGALRAQRAASAETDAQGVILAPASGRVLKADVPAGSVVSPGQSVATITAGPPILRLDLPDTQGAVLRAGQAVTVAAEDLGGAVSATVIQVYPMAEGGRVRVDLNAPRLEGLMVGQRVRVRIQVGERRALVIPARYVITRYGADYVRLATASGAMETPVQLAPGPMAGQVEALSGISAGDVLVAPEARE